MEGQGFALVVSPYLSSCARAKADEPQRNKALGDLDVSLQWMLTPNITEQFALLESSYVIIRIMQSFSDIESRDSEPWREKLMLTCMSFGGCKVALTPTA